MTPRTETFYKYSGEIAQDLDTPILASLVEPAPVCGRDQSSELETYASTDALASVTKMFRSGLKSVHVAGISGDVARDAVLLSLARVLAETGRRVLVVDADADGPPLAQAGHHGLSDVLVSGEPVTKVIVPSPGYDGMMAFLPIGTEPAVLETPGTVEPLVRIFEDLRPAYDATLVSAPCLDRRGKVHVAATATETVLLVLSPTVIPRDRIRRNFLQLWGVESPIRGIVTLGLPDVVPHVLSREGGAVPASPGATGRPPAGPDAATPDPTTSNGDAGGPRADLPDADLADETRTHHPGRPRHDDPPEAASPRHDAPPAVADPDETTELVDDAIDRLIGADETPDDDETTDATQLTFAAADASDARHDERAADETARGGGPRSADADAERATSADEPSEPAPRPDSPRSEPAFASARSEPRSDAGDAPEPPPFGDAPAGESTGQPADSRDLASVEQLARTTRYGTLTSTRREARSRRPLLLSTIGVIVIVVVFLALRAAIGGDGGGAGTGETDEAVLTADSFTPASAPPGEGPSGGGSATGVTDAEASPPADVGAAEGSTGGASAGQRQRETPSGSDASPAPATSDATPQGRASTSGTSGDRATTSAPPARAETPREAPARKNPPSTTRTLDPSIPKMVSRRFAGVTPFYSIHITSFQSVDRAVDDAKRFEAATGHPSDYIDYTIASGPSAGAWYRVIVGRFDDLEEARAAARKIIASGITHYARVYAISGS